VLIVFCAKYLFSTLLTFLYASIICPELEAVTVHLETSGLPKTLCHQSIYEVFHLDTCLESPWCERLHWKPTVFKFGYLVPVMSYLVPDHGKCRTKLRDIFL